VEVKQGGNDMKPNIKLATAMLAGAALGALAVKGLHAQAKPPVYLIAEIDVTNPEAYAKEYASLAQPMIKSAGGRFLAAGGALKPGEASVRSTGTVAAFAGEAPRRVAIIQWDSIDAARAWYDSAEYQKLDKIGRQYATFRTFAVDALPTN
jgi:uncharacterized protein (DUF1330 family)